MIDNYSRIKLLTNKYASEGLSAGDLGYIIEVYEDAYEVEFSDKNGITIAQIVAQPDEIQSDEPEQTAPRTAKDGIPELATMTTVYRPVSSSHHPKKKTVVSE